MPIDSTPLMRTNHRIRDHPYEDELDQAFCEECETLCISGNPCLCCWAEMSDEESHGGQDER